jgi:pentatricopeptide repeat protein
MTTMKEAGEGRRKRLRPRRNQEPPFARTWHILCSLLLATTFLGPSTTTRCSAFLTPTVVQQLKSPSRLVFLSTRISAAVDSDASEGSLSGESNRLASLKSDAASAGASNSNAEKDSSTSIIRNNDLETYEINLQIAALAQQCANRKNATAAVEAVKLLRSMSHPDTVAYNTVLKVLAKLSPYKIDGRQTAASLALSILDEMKDVYSSQWTANQKWYTRMADNVALSEAASAQGPPRIHVKPNVRSYSTVMDALARNGKVESAEQAEALLAELHDAYYETDDWAMQPNLITYNTVLTAWAKAAAGAGSCSEMAAEHCVRILEYMPVAPDTISYNTVLHAVARSGWEDSGERAEGLLRSMGDQGVAVNARSYTTCMDAWGQSGCPDKAQALLKEMEELYEQTKNEQLKPNCISYSTVIHAYASSSKDHPDKAKIAYDIFQGMLAKGVPPNTVTYNNLLNCLATSKPQPELIGLVAKLYQQVLTENMPDHYTFGTVLKACGNLLFEDAGFAPAVFREACERGHVSSGVLWQLRQAVPVDSYRELVGNDQIAWTELPPKWTRNVRDDRMRRKRW